MNRQVRVARRAAGVPGPEVFEVVDTNDPHCPPGGALVRVLYAGVDPGMRGWLSAEKNYLTVPDGAVMRALGVGEILASDSDAWTAGDLVYGWLGWQRVAAVAPADLLWKIDPSLAPPSAWLGVLGLGGLTAWIGFHHFGMPRAGEVMLVTTAAGQVGGTVGQLSAAAGVRAVGLTSTAEKVRLAVDSLGYANAIDYRAVPDLEAAVAEACPHGIDIFFDNTAGWIADAVFPSLNAGARIVQCGTAAVADWNPAPPGPRRERDLLVKRLHWRGFVVFDHADLFADALVELKRLYAAGRLNAPEHVLDGLDAAPTALELLYRGANTGRLCIRV